MADKLHAFVRAIRSRTEEGKVNWEPTVDEGVFQAAFPNYTVRIWTRPTRYPDAEGSSLDVCQP